MDVDEVCLYRKEVDTSKHAVLECIDWYDLKWKARKKLEND